VFFLWVLENLAGDDVWLKEGGKGQDRERKDNRTELASAVLATATALSTQTPDTRPTWPGWQQNRVFTPYAYMLQLGLAHAGTAIAYVAQSCSVSTKFVSFCMVYVWCE
jgi:hypothetical protein